MKVQPRWRWTAAALVIVTAVAIQGCGVSRRQAAVHRAETRSFMGHFMDQVLKDDWEGAFSSIDIDSLVNYGRPQGEFYRSLPVDMKERYRRDFIQGIYAFLYRETPRDEAPEPRLHFFDDPLTVEVSGTRDSKRLHFHLEQREGRLVIVGVEKGDPAAVQSPG